MLYTLLIYGAPEAQPADGTSAADEMHQAYFAYTQELLAAGAMQHGAPLQSVDTATTVRVRDGQRLITDGPFAETKEHLMGFYLVDCADLDGALEWAAKIPGAAIGSIEVRPVLMIPGM